MAAGRKDYDRAALMLVVTERRLAQVVMQACAKARPIRRESVLFEAALRDALADTSAPTSVSELLDREPSTTTTRRSRSRSSKPAST